MTFGYLTSQPDGMHSSRRYILISLLFESFSSNTLKGQLDSFNIKSTLPLDIKERVARYYFPYSVKDEENTKNLISLGLCEKDSKRTELSELGRELLTSMKIRTKPMKKIKMRGAEAETLLDEMFAELK